MHVVQSHRVSAVAFTVCSESCADVRQGDRLGFAYACAKLAGAPMLTKGAGFPETDIAAASQVRTRIISMKMGLNGI
jgi:uncharacterized protein with PIN domain